MKFYDRREEIKLCRKIMSSEKQEAFILYGRRRVGKTALILECTKNMNGIYFVGIKAPAPEILKRFSKAVAAFLGMRGITFENWESALRAIFEKATVDKLYLALDEFQYIVESSPELPSILQLLLDEYQYRSKLKLILCGSSMSFMEGILSYKNPLYGRATARLKLSPVRFEALKQFIPQYDYHQLLEVYSIVGGVPMYLNLWNGQKSIFENVSDLFLKIGAPLREEPLFILMTELKEPRVFQSILEALSMGRNTSSQITSYAGFADSRKIQPYLRKLQELSIIKRLLPALLKNPRRTRNIRYEISDQLFRFWYRFIFPNIDRLEVGDSKAILNAVRENFDQYVSFEFERQAMIKSAEVMKATRFGKLWKGAEEIDFAAQTEHGIVAGEFKWWRKKVGISVLYDLKRKSEKLSLKPQLYLLASRAGFEEELFKEKNLVLLVLDKKDGWKVLKNVY